MPKVSLVEALGISPLRLRIEQGKLAVLGDAYSPKSRVGLSTLKILKPTWAAQLWAGRRPYGRELPIYNLFNRTPTPESEGWSLRKSQVHDFRGGTLSYDSHNATDFATPPGTRLVAPAAGMVRLIVDEYHRGGKKLMLDHGRGLVTVMAHLARTLVQVGDEVAPGQVVALSGASGINFVAAAFMDPPHLHFGTWLNGVAVDPFAVEGETSLWDQPNAPTPMVLVAGASLGDHSWRDPAAYDDVMVADQIAACIDPVMQAKLRAVPDAAVRACHVIFYRNYFPTRFRTTVPVSRIEHPRTPRLALPFLREDYDSLRF